MPEPADADHAFLDVSHSVAAFKSAGQNFALDHGMILTDTMFFLITAGIGIVLISVASMVRRHHRRRLAWGIVPERPLPFTRPGPRS